MNIAEGMSIRKGTFFRLLFLFSSSLVTVYFYHRYILEALSYQYNFTSQSNLFVSSLFMLFYGVSILFGGYLSDKYDRRRLIQLWSLGGVLIQTVFAFFHSTENLPLFSVVIGLSLGWGLPACFSYLSDVTSIEERGRVSGILQLIVFLLVLFIVVLPQGYVDVQTAIYISIVIRGITLLVPVSESTLEKRERVSYVEILKVKRNLVYLIPWVIYNICNSLLMFVEQGIPNTDAYVDVFATGPILFFLATCFFGVLSGFLADRSGRKLPLILGFITLGTAYAFVGISVAPSNIMLLYLFQGIAWGFILVCYQWIILGDLAKDYQCDKYYAIGLVIPPLIETLFLSYSTVVQPTISPNLVASILSIIMFISVLPLLFAPETLPDELIQDRRFKEYMRKVMEIVEESDE
jgi:MFS family permease